MTGEPLIRKVDRVQIPVGTRGHVSLGMAEEMELAKRPASG